MQQLARRHLLLGGIAGLPLAAILADPRLARAAAAKLDKVTLKTQGGRDVSASLALPAVTPAPAILLVHEWWGLNDQIKSVAGEFAAEGYVALAVDLYDGKVADTRDGAQALMKAVDPAVAGDTLGSWIAWLKGHDKVAGKIGTVGWCFGGGWSLNASTLAPVDATVVYYGRVNQAEEQLARLQGPVLGHFASRDQWINQEMVGGFEAKMKALGKSVETHWYEADHAFANPSGGRYDAEDAQLSWRRTLDFFRANL
jgi:carboxymethylenebutenolidase